MSIGYTWEKLYSAVRALACSDGTLQNRLANAYRAMSMLTVDDFPDDELQKQYARLVHALRPRDPGGVESPVAPPAIVLRPDQAQSMAEMLLRLYTDITRLEEQHYRALPSREL